MEVAEGIHDHREPYPGDNGLLFEPDESYREEDFPPLDEETKQFVKESVEQGWFLD